MAAEDKSKAAADDDAYVPMTSDEPLEFSNDEERMAVFRDMVKDALKSYAYGKLKGMSYFDLQGICGSDARWIIFKSSGPKKEVFEKYQAQRVAVLKKEHDRQRAKKAALEKGKKDMIYAAALINQTKGCDLVQRCVNLGTDPNCTLSPGPRPSKNGKTAFSVAAKHGYLRTLDLLHQHDADRNQT